MAAAVRNVLLRNGRYYARVVVPKSLRKHVGKSELLKPLGADRRSALERAPRAVAAMRDELAKARKAVGISNTPLTPIAIDDLMRLHYQEELDRDDRARDTPSELSGVTVPDMNRLFGAGRAKALERIVAGQSGDEEIQAVVGVSIDVFRERGLISVEFGEPGYRACARQVALAELEALRRTFERDEGDYGGKSRIEFLNAPVDEVVLRERESISGLLEDYGQVLALSDKGGEAIKRWRPCFTSLSNFTRHDDANQLTRAEVIRWRDELLKTLSPKTVRDSHIAGLKAVLAWAVDAGKLETNVATDVKVRVPRATRSREKGLTDDEARALLAAARDYAPELRRNARTNEGAKLTAAKRWVPWLCAHTGARVAEMTQLRKEDVYLDAEAPYLRITPAAGSVKTGQYRDVPIHAELLDIGFGKFVRASGVGPLFYGSGERKKGGQPPQKQVAGRLSNWVRSLKILPPEVDPSHGWRHRFKTVARDVGLDARVVDAIQGHAPRTAGEAYGDVSPRAKAVAVQAMPRYFPGNMKPSHA